MITDTDIKKLKGVFATKTDLDSFAKKADLDRFATKTDLKRFATKADLKRFATKADLKRFATKRDLKKFATKTEFSELKADVKKLDQRVEKIDERLYKQGEDIEELKERTHRIELNAISRTEFAGLTEQIETLGKNFDKRMDKLSENIDALAKGMDIEKSEYTAIGLQLDRHINDKSVHLNPIHS